jgi:NAD(P)-dependent dehydrogenase (short-subunit alcohol dehydrogenase family)
MRLEDKVAVVTGAGRGIGRAYAFALAGEGAAVCIAELNPEWGQVVADEMAEHGYKAIAVPTDVADPQSVERMVDRTIEAYGGIDILVNNAAIFANDVARSYNPIVWDPLTGSVEQWQQMMRVNVEGVLLAIRAVVPSMIERGAGRIVNQSSVAAFMETLGPYGFSKYGVIYLTRMFATALAPHHINVNAIAPTAVVTEATMTRVERTLQEREEYVARAAQPDDLVGTLLYLVSRDSDLVSGQTIEVARGTIRRP